MTLKEISQVLSARVLCGDDDALNAEVTSACGSDMMSDVWLMSRTRAYCSPV